MQWNQIKPPVTADQTNVLTLTATAASDPVELTTPEKDQVLWVVCTAAFNIVFSDGNTLLAALGDPADLQLFAAGVPHAFGINSKNTGFIMITHVNASALYWKGSR